MSEGTRPRQDPTAPDPAAATPSARRDRTHWLYVAVIVAVVLGIVVGFVAPDFAKQLRPLGTGFVNLVKMMIGPVIFCTIVLGIGSVRKAASVGRVGGLALVYFLAMSTVALAIGLVVGNLIHPGEGLNLTGALAQSGREQATGEAESTIDFLLGIIPTTMVSALTEGEVLQALLVALLVGFAVQSMGASGQPILNTIGYLQGLLFTVRAFIMWAAPIGAFGVMAAVVGSAGGAVLPARGWVPPAFSASCSLSVVVVSRL